MGEARRRKAAIAELKRAQMELRARLNMSSDDEALMGRGFSPDPGGIEELVRYADLLSRALQDAKSTGSVDLAVKLIRDSVDATWAQMSDVPVACHRGCSHCCHVWVTVSALEALDVATRIQSDAAAVDRVRRAHARSQPYDFDKRSERSFPCPFLIGNECSIYSWRPRACATAGSADAEICRRSYIELANENIPTPMIYMGSRAKYHIALSAALRRVGLSSKGYEFNDAVVCALDTERSVERWLAGED